MRPLKIVRSAALAGALLVLFVFQVHAQSQAKVNVNTASEEEIAALPGVGKKTAARIVAKRPYSSASDLSRAGVSSRKIDRIAPMISFEGASAAAPAAAENAASAPGAAGESTSSKHRHKGENAESSAAGASTAQQPPAPGMVWVNPKTKVYHVQGDPYYGNTKNGRWMTQADAEKGGYHKSKQYSTAE